MRGSSGGPNMPFSGCTVGLMASTAQSEIERKTWGLFHVDVKMMDDHSATERLHSASLILMLA